MLLLICFVVECGYYFCMGMGVVFEELQQRNAYIDSVLVDFGWLFEGIEWVANWFIFCSTLKKDMQDVIEQLCWQIRVSRTLMSGGVLCGGCNEVFLYFGELDEEVWQWCMIIGDFDECIRCIQNLVDVGIMYIFGFFEFGGLDYDVAMWLFVLFFEQVMFVIRDIVFV